MSPVLDARLSRLDVAFGRLRRLWESPALRRRFVQRVGAQIEPGVVRTLRAVRQGDAETGVSDVAAELGVDTSTASRLVDSAVTAGYLARGPSDRDGRRCVLAITGPGDDILDRALRIREELLSELTDGWSDRDVERLADLVERLARRVTELENHS